MTTAPGACLRCGKPVDPRRRNCDICKAAIHREKARADYYRDYTPTRCIICGKAIRKGGRYCSTGLECQRARNREYANAWYARHAAEARAKRRKAEPPPPN